MSLTSTGSEPTHVDVLVIGAGISGIGVGYHLKKLQPEQSFLILEGRDAIGGTWSLFRYPGVRSDSDMPTFGYGFKPWTHRKAIADGDLVLDYLQEVVDENGLEEHLRFSHHVVGADFDSGTGLWTVTTRQGGTGQVTFTSRFLFLGTGYYDIDRGFTPLFAGVDDFEGRVVHPQQWPEDLDYTGKRVVVIGSGATAVTLVPSMAGAAGHVTMLQRSPGYVFSIPAEDRVANVLNTVLGPPRAHGVIRRKNIAFARALFKACRRSPKLMRRLLIANVRRQLPRHFDVDTHFTPRYLPWEQRLCMVPDGDLFRALSAGTASVVTGRIERFTKAGILLESGQEIAADIVVTATGLTMQPFGKVRIAVDGMPVDVGERFSFKAMMLAGVPNLAYALGYTNISWTLKVDLVADHFCRLLEHMRDNGYDMFEPVLDDPHMERLPLMDLKAGYVQRGIDRFPKSGSRGPWRVEHAYEFDVARLRDGPVTDGVLRFTTTAPAEPRRAAR